MGPDRTLEVSVGSASQLSDLLGALTTGGAMMLEKLVIADSWYQNDLNSNQAVQGVGVGSLTHLRDLQLPGYGMSKAYLVSVLAAAGPGLTKLALTGPISWTSATLIIDLLQAIGDEVGRSAAGVCKGLRSIMSLRLLRFADALQACLFPWRSGLRSLVLPPLQFGHELAGGTAVGVKEALMQLPALETLQADLAWEGLVLGLMEARYVGYGGKPMASR
jgi:hypothetical protein